MAVKKKVRAAAKKALKRSGFVRLKKGRILNEDGETGKDTGALDKYKLRIDFLEKEMSILRVAGEITNKDFDLNVLLERFLEMLMNAIGAEAGSLLLVDKPSETLNFTVALGKKGRELKDVRLRMGEGIAGWVAQCGKPLLTPDVKSDPRFNPKMGKAIHYTTRNIVCVPLKYEDDVLGVVELLNKKGKDAFDESDMKVLQAFTPYISVIIKNAQLFLENRLRIRRLEHLMELSEYVNSTLNLNTLFDKILEISTDTLAAEAGSIMMLDEEKQELKFSAATGTKAEKLKDIRVPVGEGIAGWVAREGKSVLIADAQNDPRFFRKADHKTEFKTRSVIAVPLKTKDKLIGVLEVLNKKNNEPFNDDDVSMLEALSNQAAVAVENAKLYANVRELFLNTVRSLAAAIETKDLYTRGHSERVTMFSELIARELGFSGEETENLNLAGLLHDIGKIGIDESILRKPSKLTPAEFGEIRKHPEYAANILATIPQLRHIIPSIKHHHERYDGNGYPAGLRGEDIPYFSRILAIADTFDAMNSSRPYRAALPFSVCLAEIERCSGTQFDPEISAMAVKAFRKWHETANKKGKKGELNNGLVP
jgi:HD-GYP domain-containing protein (c-di-GMP phosphodiesterase class II)